MLSFSGRHFWKHPHTYLSVITLKLKTNLVIPVTLSLNVQPREIQACVHTRTYIQTPSAPMPLCGIKIRTLSLCSLTKTVPKFECSTFLSAFHLSVVCGLCSVCTDSLLCMLDLSVFDTCLLCLPLTKRLCSVLLNRDENTV